MGGGEFVGGGVKVGELAINDALEAGRQAREVFKAEVTVEDNDGARFTSETEVGARESVGTGEDLRIAVESAHER